jgi:cell division protein FtsI/penicillin-binding protein 2
MGRRRFLPLIAAVVIGALVLMARLFTVQISERDVWTVQAEALVRQGKIEPYTRGEIRDRRGLVLAKDIEAYRIDAEYRDFRRGNALGVVAHARAALEQRAVGLAESQAQLGAWATALAELSPAALTDFQSGKALRCGPLDLPPLARGLDEARMERGLDISFYATALFELSARERSALRNLKDEAREQSFLNFVALQRKQTREQLQFELAARCENDLRFLSDFAQLWAADALHGHHVPSRRDRKTPRPWRGGRRGGRSSLTV